MTSITDHQEPVLRLELRDLRKAYGHTQALDGLSLDVSSGELLGVAGPNGAGKSTLVRMISGEELLDSGDMLLNGQSWSPRLSDGRVSVVHQEIMLFPYLTVAENLVLDGAGNGLGARPVATTRHREILRRLGIDVYADRELGRCSLVVRQLTEIARALARADQAQLFLFDEPNSALTEAESAELFSQMRALSDSGNIVILVSHRLNELVHVADRVVVARDGKISAEFLKASLTEERLAREIVVGLAEHPTESVSRAVDPSAQADSIALTVKQWRHARGSFDIGDLTVRQREIVAVVGVEGSGGRELVRSLAGLEAATGKITLPRGDTRSITYLPADRGESLFADLTVGESLVARLGRGRIAGRTGLLNRRAMVQLAARYMEEFRVQAASQDQPIGALSGGNQQKVAIASAIAEQPLVLMLEEPTRGVDVGSKAEIHRILRHFVNQGGAIVAYCTEILEVFEVADRAVVMSHGSIAGELDVTDYEDIGSLAEAAARMAGGSGTPATGGDPMTDGGEDD